MTRMLLIVRGIAPEAWSHEITHVPGLLGRDLDADIRLEHLSISRRHCRFWRSEDGFYVEDCGSRNGTYVNGERIDRCRLDAGDRILVGNFELMLAPVTSLKSTMFEPQDRAPFEPIPEDRLAVEVHRRLTPSRRLGLPGLLVEVEYAPIGQLGGDAFECFQLGERWVLALFDPMNHGVNSALTIMLVRAELQRWIALSAQPAKCLESINNELVAMGIQDVYISGCLAIWHPATEVLVYATAGQHPPILLRSGLEFRLGREAGGCPLGVIPGEKFNEEMLQLRPNDRFFLFTDGVWNPATAESAMDPVAVRMAKRLVQWSNLGLSEQVRKGLESQPTAEDDALLVGCQVSEEESAR